jgi:hypothetical protein
LTGSFQCVVVVEGVQDHGAAFLERVVIQVFGFVGSAGFRPSASGYAYGGVKTRSKDLRIHLPVLPGWVVWGQGYR